MSAAVQTAAPDLQLVDLEERPAHPLATVAPSPRAAGTLAEVTPMQMLQLAVQSGDLDRAERFYALVQQVKADAARDAYVEAMAAFKRNPPTILKTREANFGTTKDRGAQGASYSYADHASVVLPIAKGLAEHGFSHDWEIEQRDGHVHVTCVVTHRLGHSKRVHLFAAPDNGGSKSGLQAIASTNTFLQRYTLLAATGMSTALPGAMGDDDGRGGPPPAANDDGRGEPPFDGPYVDERLAERAAAPAPVAPAVNCYSDAEFAANLPVWTEKIAGGKDADRLMPFVSSRTGLSFTEEQKKTLRAIKRA